jgi:PAS domain S-box-containing protein
MTLETVHQRKNGSTFPVEVNAGCVQLDRRYTVAVVRDISERKRAQEEFRDSEERLRLAVHAGRMFAYSWDAATDVIKRSGESCKILGISEATPLTGEQALAKVHADDRERLKSAISELNPGNPHLQVSYRMIRADGSVVWLERTSRAYFDEHGKLLRIVGMVADITDRKLAEEALSGVSRKLIEAQEAERARIGRDLHDDFGQRLALLKVQLDQLRGVTQSSESESIRHMDAMKAQIIELSGGLRTLAHELHPARLEYLGLVAAMEGFCREFSERQVEIRFTHNAVPEAVPPELSFCLFRVLQESLHNAIKHSGARYFEVDLRGTPESILLTVSDHGVGFDHEKISQGRGLGITSMQERLKSVNGELSIASHLGQGTIVSARVPFRTINIDLPAAG